MVQIQVFQVNQNRTQLDVTVKTTAGNTIQTVTLWNQDTFKNYPLALDFTNKLTQISNTETFTISADEISESILDGIYFIEITDDSTSQECAGCSNIALGVATDFTRFQFCIMKILCGIEAQCVGCDNELHKALTYKLYIDGLRNSLQLGNFNTAITFWKNLNRNCSSKCTECSNLSFIAKKGLGFQTLNNSLILY